MLENSDVKDAYWCVVSGSDIWIVDNQLPFGQASQFNIDESLAIVIGRYKNHPVMWVNDADLEEERELLSLRTLLQLDNDLFLLASKAVQYGYMTQSMRYCSVCGGRNHLNHQELAMQCNDCRTMHYPRIFPCIIVAIRRNDKILLAQHNRHKGNMYTVIAGFLEVGETLEQCVAREVYEETGIQVQNIRYFGSQPWAFPSSMMMAFLCDYQSGDIRVDYTELHDARWFDRQSLPEVAPVGTIARSLIEATLDNIDNDKKNPPI
jgi:NAD+ diphosphatase